MPESNRPSSKTRPRRRWRHVTAALLVLTAVRPTIGQSAHRATERHETYRAGRSTAPLIVQPSRPSAFRQAPAARDREPATRRKRWSWPDITWPWERTRAVPDQPTPRSTAPSYRAVPADRPRADQGIQVLRPPARRDRQRPVRRRPRYPYRPMTTPLEQWPQPLDGNLVVGYRLTRVSLDDNSRGGTDPYYGHVIGLEVDNGIDLFRSLYADWYPTKWWHIDLGAGLAWSHVEAATRNIEGHSDGSIEAGGPVLTAIARVPVHQRIFGYQWTFEPCVGLGVAYLQSDFNHAAWWHHGFGLDLRGGGNEADARADYDDWVDRGSPEDEILYTRTIRTDSTMGWVFRTGIRASHGPLGIDVFLRRLNADIEGTYTQEWNSEQDVSQDVGYPLTGWTYGIGASYAF